MKVVDDAEAQYLAFFASKTIGMIRAPDSFVYPAPFNLIETFIIAPLEYVSLFVSHYMPINLKNKVFPCREAQRKTLRESEFINTFFQLSC